MIRKMITAVITAVLLALALVVAPVATPSAQAYFPVTSWPSAWSNPVQGGASFTMTTKWGALSLGCTNAERTNDAMYYLSAPSTIAHTGIDMDRGDGQIVVAIADGTVVENGSPWGTAWGRVVVIEHTASTGEKFVAVYAHLQSDVVARGPIRKGSYVGRVSTTGTGAHLHFGIHPGPWTGVTPAGSSNSAVNAGRCTFDPKGTVDPLSFLGARTPQGQAVPTPSITSTQSAGRSASGDFTGDGKPDVLALYDYGNGTAGLFVTPGTTSTGDLATAPYRVWYQGTPWSWEVSRTTLTVGDFNGDGKADVLAMYDYGNGTAGLWVFPGTSARGDGATAPYRVWYEGHQGWWWMSQVKVA